MNDPKRPRGLVAVGLGLVALIAIVVAALALASGGGSEDPTTDRAPAEAPAEGAAPPGAGMLPPGIPECLAEQGYDVEPSDLHSVPQEALETCFDALHEGGAGP